MARWMVVCLLLCVSCAAGPRARPWRPPRFDDSSCSSLAQPERAICQVTLRIQEARRERDIVRLICLDDKRVQLGALLETSRAGELAREAAECVGLQASSSGLAPGSF